MVNASRVRTRAAIKNPVLHTSAPSIQGILSTWHACGVQAADERATRENNSLVERNQRMVRELQEQMATNARLAEVNRVKAAELKQKEEAVRSLQSETAKVVKVKEAALARIKAMEKQKEEIEKVNEQLRQGLIPACNYDSCLSCKISSTINSRWRCASKGLSSYPSQTGEG